MNHKKPAQIAGFLTVAIVAFALMAHAAIISDGLVGRWIFDEVSGITASDSSGFGNDGMLSGAALFASDAQRGQVLSITGLSGQVGIPYNSRLEPFSGTVSVWVKPTLATTADLVHHTTDALLRCNNTGSRYYAYALRVYSNGAPAAIFANDDPRTCKKAPQIVVSGSARSIKVNQWTHLVMRWDGVKTLNLFANGKLVAKASYSPNPTAGLSYHGNADVVVGGGLNSDLEFSGAMSDLRIYSRALSNEEISAIYAQGQ